MMMIPSNYAECVTGADIAAVWKALFLKAIKPGANNLGPTMVVVRPEDAVTLVESDTPLRVEIDTILRSETKATTHETSGIIFPYNVWKAKGKDLDKLTSWNNEMFMPRLKKLAPPQRRQTYFNRMVNYEDGSEVPSERSNQLKFVINLCKAAEKHDRHHRQAGLQIAIYDPKRDLSRTALCNFPCLQQIGFYFLDDGGLGVSAYYPTQQIVERAYGNYLGLCQLGVFMAYELEVSFKELSCFVGSPRLGGIGKTKLRTLEKFLAEQTNQASASVPD